MAMYWRLIVAQRRWVFIFTAVATLAAIGIGFLLPPVYRAETLLVPVEQEKSEGLGTLTGQLGDLAAIAGIKFGPGKDKTAEFVAALNSRALSVSFIKEKNLMPVLFESQWDSVKKRWKAGVDPPTEWQAYNLWDKTIRRVSIDRRSGLITVAIEWHDPVLAAKWANELVQNVNSRLRAEAVEEADRSVDYLQKQLPQTNAVEVQQAIYRLIEAQTKKKMIASTRGEYAFATIDPAVPPEARFKPNRSAIAYVGLLLGLALGILAAIVAGRKQDMAAAEKSS